MCTPLLLSLKSVMNVAIADRIPRIVDPANMPYKNFDISHSLSARLTPLRCIRKQLYVGYRDVNTHYDRHACVWAYLSSLYQLQPGCNECFNYKRPITLGLHRVHKKATGDDIENFRQISTQAQTSSSRLCTQRAQRSGTIWTCVKSYARNAIIRQYTWCCK